MKNLQKGFSLAIVIAAIAAFLGIGARVATNSNATSTPQDSDKYLSTLETLQLAQKAFGDRLPGTDLKCVDFDGIRENGVVTYNVYIKASASCSPSILKEPASVTVNLTTGATSVLVGHPPVNPATQVTPPIQSNQPTKQFKIPEFGLEFTLDNNISDLAYSVGTIPSPGGPGSGGGAYLSFYTKSLATKEKYCTAGSLGILDVLNVAQFKLQFIDKGRYVNTLDAVGPVPTSGNISIFRVGDYFMAYEHPQALCSETDSGTSLEVAQIKSFIDALRTIKIGAPVTTTPSLQVLSPNGGETIDITKPLTISFKPNGERKHYGINLVDDANNINYSLYTLPGGHQDPNMRGCTGGPTCNTGTYFTDQEIAQSPNKQSITVTVPADMNVKPGNKFKIRIWNDEDSSQDMSDGYFTLTNSQYIDSLTYTGKTDIGISFSVKYPPNWGYIKFSCNADGVAFWPKSRVPMLSEASNCSANGALQTAPIIVYTDSQPMITLMDTGFTDIYTKMKSSLVIQ